MTNRDLEIGCAAPVALVVGLAVAVAACAGTPLADPQAVAREEARLMQPFQGPQTLAASEFELTITANFYGKIEQPPRSQAFDLHREPTADGGTTYTFTTRVPGARPMLFAVDQTKLLVENRMVLRVLGGTHQMTLDAIGRGVTLHRGSDAERLGSIEIRDGAFRRVP